MKLRLFFIKLTEWEYWPFSVVYFPIFFYWLWLALRARSLFFFSAVNPSIETGGMLGESKNDILKRIPERWLPNTIFVKNGTTAEQILLLLSEKKLIFPLIAKPDVGQRGTRVEKLGNSQELMDYISSSKVDFLIQEFIDYSFEAGVFYFRHPDEDKGKISSVVVKEYLKVRGDGVSTIYELMKRYPRAAFQLERLGKKNSTLMKSVPAKNAEILLEPIGNHCRGTRFLDGCNLIDDKLVQVFDEISATIDGFFYGRFDVKCTSAEDLKKGKNIKILELNGAGAEPAHIYAPGISIVSAYKVLFYHWRQLFEISRKNRKLGYTYMSLKEAWTKYRWIKANNKLLS